MAAPPARIAHVKRIHKLDVNPDFPDDPAQKFNDIWIDVLRIDKLPVKFQPDTDPSGVEGQIIYYILKWNDDINNPDPNIDASNADIQFENANPSRRTKKIAIKDPTDPTIPPPPEDTDQPVSTVDNNSVYLWIVQKLKVEQPRGKDFPIGQDIVFVFNNRPLDGSEGDPSKSRKVSLIKVVNNDLGSLQMMDADGNPLIIDWDTYLAALQDGKTDDTDFRTVEFVDRSTVDFGVLLRPPGIKAQGIAYILTGNRDIENLFEAGDPKAVDVDGNSAVIRLDPLQVIVNVGSNIIAVEFAPGGEEESGQ